MKSVRMKKKRKKGDLALEVVAVPFGLVMEPLIGVVLELFVTGVAS